MRFILIEDIKVRHIEGHFADWIKRKGLQQVRCYDPAKSWRPEMMMSEIVRIAPERFYCSRTNRELRVAWTPEVAEALGMPMSCYTSMQSEIADLRRAVEHGAFYKKRFLAVLRLGFFSRLWFAITGKEPKQ